MAEKQAVRMAVIGAGGMGTKYIRYMLGGSVPGMELKAVVARSESSKQTMEALCGSAAAVYRSEDELYEHSDTFDAVLIVTPHKTHPAMGVNALNHGKHVLMDKPIAVSVADCETLIETARKKDLVFSVMFQQRAYPKYQKIKTMLEHGEFGKLYRIQMETSRYFRTSYYHQSGAWRSSWNGEGGGALINQGQHILDLWQWLFGMPESICANIRFGKYNDFKVDDEAFLFMYYPNGKTGTFFLTTGEGTWQERLVIAGSRATMILEDQTLTVHRYSTDLDEYRATASVTSTQQLQEVITSETFGDDPDTYPYMLENFVQAIRKEKPLLSKGIDAINALELTNAAYLSAWKNKTVTLPVSHQEYHDALEERMKEESENKQQ